jgi:hypothetical protein
MPGNCAGLDQAGVLHVQLRGQGRQRELRDHDCPGQAAVVEKPEPGAAGFCASLGATAGAFLALPARPIPESGAAQAHIAADDLL